jgi:hypothetical protein
MQAEIYVVLTEIHKMELKYLEMSELLLKSEKTFLTKLFSGLTVISNLNGDWINDLGLIDSDSVEIWRICSNKAGLELKQQINLLMASAHNIKMITSQKCQMLTIDMSVEPIFL